MRKIQTTSLIIKLARRPDSSGGCNIPRRADMPDGPEPDPFRSPATFFVELDALAAAESYLIFDINFKFNKLRRSSGLKINANGIIVHKHTNHFIPSSIFSKKLLFLSLVLNAAN